MKTEYRTQKNNLHNQAEIRSIFYLVICFLIFSGCKKVVEIPPPQITTTSSEVFSNDKLATAALVGIYSSMVNSGSTGFWNAGATLSGGMSADELIPFDQDYGDGYVQFQQNNLIATNSQINNLWAPAYSIIYQANSVIQGLSDYSGVHEPLKTELIGEAKFIRGFCYFYLINFFGDVPLVNTTDWNKTNLLKRQSVTIIYQQILTDLKDAQAALSSDYSIADNQRIRANKYAATAMLARVYLYLKDWKNAEAQASLIITNTGLYSLDNSLNDVFLVNSSEAILQLQQTNAAPIFNATTEGSILIPNTSNPPNFYLTPTILNAFEANDQRKTSWIDSTSYGSPAITYYFPYKYKIGPGQANFNDPIPQYYMVLRLAEQYLIRAEAEANGAGGGLNAAITDLNIIRHRAGLANYSGQTLQAPVLAAIVHERQVELFAEWGHRWLDLKRWNTATTVLPANKGFTISQNSLLYPIPQTEIQTDPNLTQNPGY